MTDSKRLLGTAEILKILDIPAYKLDYLFKSRKLKPEDFTTLNSGQRIYKYSDLQKIKLVLFEVAVR